jgi:hypothetical protein
MARSDDIVARSDWRPASGLRSFIPCPRCGSSPEAPVASGSRLRRPSSPPATASSPPPASRTTSAILQVAELPDPPLRLLLGSDASYLAELVADHRAAEDARWRSLSVSTDYEGLGDFRARGDGQAARLEPDAHIAAGDDGDQGLRAVEDGERPLRRHARRARGGAPRAGVLGASRRRDDGARALPPAR